MRAHSPRCPTWCPMVRLSPGRMPRTWCWGWASINPVLVATATTLCVTYATHQAITMMPAPQGVEGEVVAGAEEVVGVDGVAIPRAPLSLRPHGISEHKPM